MVAVVVRRGSNGGCCRSGWWSGAVICRGLDTVVMGEGGEMAGGGEDVGEARAGDALCWRWWKRKRARVAASEACKRLMALSSHGRQKAAKCFFYPPHQKTRVASKQLALIHAQSRLDGRARHRSRQCRARSEARARERRRPRATTHLAAVLCSLMPLPLANSVLKMRVSSKVVAKSGA